MNPPRAPVNKLLLASGSATRRTMLENAGVPFEVVSPAYVEDAAKRQLVERGESAAAIACELAAGKALSVDTSDDMVVLGSDQVLEQADGSLLSKPRSPDEAMAQLRQLAGMTHRLHSAATLIQAGELVWHVVETVSLTMRRLSDTFLSEYLAREWRDVRWNVGAYRIEGPGVQLFDRIEGCHFAILGMPLLPLLAELRRRRVLAS